MNISNYSKMRLRILDLTFFVVGWVEGESSLVSIENFPRPAYQATQARDRIALEKVAREWEQAFHNPAVGFG